MKNILCVAVALAFVAAAVPSTAIKAELEPKPELAQDLVTSYDDLGRAQVPWEEVEWVDFTLPEGVDLFTVTFDWASKDLAVVPGPMDQASAANGTDAGCSSFSLPVSDLPWARSPPGSGPFPCAYESHSTGFDRTAKECILGTDCLTDGLNFAAGQEAFFVIFCTTPSAGDDTHPGWTETSGSCGYFTDGPHPSTWTDWDSICGLSFTGPIAFGYASCRHYTDK